MHNWPVMIDLEIIDELNEWELDLSNNRIYEFMELITKREI